MSKIVVRDREAGNVIEVVASVEEGEKLMTKFQESDKKDGIYEDNFYEVAILED